MPVTRPPGVYIEEVPTGVRPVTAVDTSVAAFVGWAPRGPVDRAQRIVNWQEFVLHFGGLHRESYLGYAVRHFFDNGGQRAYVVRLVDSGTAATASNTLDGVLVLTAKNPGSWANDYGIVIKRCTDDPTRFCLAVVLVQTGGTESTETVVESYDDLSMVHTDRQFVETAINEQSLIINATVIGSPTSPPNETGSPAMFLCGGSDGNVLIPNTADFEAALRPTSGDGGVFHLDRNPVDNFNLLCVPGETNATELQQLQKFCRNQRAFLIADSTETATFNSLQSGPNSTLTGSDSINSALYFPWLNAPDPLRENQPRAFPPCGFVAGIYARTDISRGVWKAPAGTEATVTGVTGVQIPLTDIENGMLNPLGVNCIREFPAHGIVVWGARTLIGANEQGSDWKYISVRRLALLIEESIYQGTKWVVFEPNDEPLWAKIRLNVGAFMHKLFRQGAFQGATPGDAYFVKCNQETTTQFEIDQGIVNILVGFAPLKPSEFVVAKIQRMTSESQT